DGIRDRNVTGVQTCALPIYANTQAGSEFGGFGGLFKLSQRRPSDNTGTLTLFFLGDVDHTSFDNLAFWTEDLLVAVEDRGDSLQIGRASCREGRLILCGVGE